MILYFYHNNEQSFTISTYFFTTIMNASSLAVLTAFYLKQIMNLCSLQY